MLGVPIFIEDELIGVINVVRDEPGRFSDEHIELVKTFADQAAIAIANARLIDAVERQLEQQRAIASVLSAVAKADGLDPVFDTAVAAAVRLCAAEYGALYLAGEKGFAPVVAHGGAAKIIQYEREHPHSAESSSLVGRVLLTRQTVHIADVLDDPEYSHATQTVAGFRTMAGTPILIEGDLVGVLAIVRNEPQAFSEDQIQLLETFADQAAIAIANARLLDAVERQRTELSRFVSPQVAELISSEDGDRMLAGHRAYVTSMFCDLRGFTSFTETAEPEELFEVLQDYHSALGELIRRYQGTLEHFAGDGLLVFFNDPCRSTSTSSRRSSSRSPRSSASTSWPSSGGSEATSSGSESGSRPATPPSAASASRAATTTACSERSRISPRASRPRPSWARP